MIILSDHELIYGQVICTPNSCEAPTPSNWVERELNGMRFFFNLVSGGQSMTRPFDGARNRSNAASCCRLRKVVSKRPDALH